MAGASSLAPRVRGGGGGNRTGDHTLLPHRRPRQCGVTGVPGTQRPGVCRVRRSQLRGGSWFWEAPHTRPKAIVRNCQVGHRQHPHPTGSGVGGGGGTLAGPDRAVHADMGVARDRVHVVHVAMSWDPYRVGRCFHEVNVSIEFYLLFETFVFPTVDLKTIFFSLRTVSTECTLGSVQGLHNTAATVSDPFLFLPATPRNLPLSLEPLRMSHVPPNPITFDPPFLGQQIAAVASLCA